MKPKKETKAEEKATPKMRRFTGKVLFLSGCAVVLSVLAAFAIYTAVFRNRFLPHTEIAGVSIGGLTQAQAADKIKSSQDQFATKTITLTYGSKTWNISPKDIGTSFSNDKALSDMWLEEKGWSWQHQVKELVITPFFVNRSEVDFTAVSNQLLKNFHDNVLKDVEVDNKEVSLSIDSTGATIVPGKAGKKLDMNDFEVKLYDAFKHTLSSFAIQIQDFQPSLTTDQVSPIQKQVSSILASPWVVTFPSTQVIVDAPQLGSLLTTKYVVNDQGITTGMALDVKDDVLKKDIQDWAKSVDQPASNANLIVDNGVVKVSQDGVNGTQVDQVTTNINIKNALVSFVAGASRTIAATIETALPAVRADTLVSLGITQKIGTATTDFSGSPVNRKANIAFGQRKLNGTLVLPGQEYSTIALLAPITTDAGYLNELVIKDNRTVPDAGGGLCQVSTTLFRAVLNAGLPYTERANHAYRVGYYERGVGPGLDATIYDPQPDFRWKNDFATAVYVQSSIKGDTITFDIYGTSDNRVSTIGQTTVFNITPPGDPIYLPTATLPTGTQKQVETPHGGAETSVDYTVVRNGIQINKQTIRSKYQPWPAQYLVGTGPAQ